MELLTYIYHLFIKTRYFKPIENCYIKIQQVYFNGFDILLETVRHRKIDFLRPRLF